MKPSNKKVSKTIGVLDASKVKFFSRAPDGKTLRPNNLQNPKVTRKIIGYVLDRIRKHGIQLSSWDSIEIDIDALPADGTSLKMDVHFLTEGSVTHGIHGLVIDLATEEMKSFEVIAIQPKMV